MLHDPKFWLAISFCLFCFLFIKYVLPLLVRALDAKSKQIADELSEAKNLKNKAQKLLIEAERYHHESIAFSNKLIADSKNEVDKFMVASVKEISENLDRKMASIFERIKQEEERSIREVKSRIIASAIKIIENNLPNKVNKKSSEEAVEDAIIEVSNAVH